MDTDCFYISAIVNNAAMNIGVHVSFLFLVVFKIEFYLFLAVLHLCCNVGFSLVVVLRLLIAVTSLVGEHELYSTDPTVVAHELKCSEACGIFPDQGLNPCLLHRQADSLPLSHQGSHVSFQINVSIFWGYIPRSEIAGSYSNSIFCSLRNLQTVFHCGYTNWHSHSQCPRVPFSPHPCQHLLFVFFLMIVIMTNVSRYLSVVLILNFSDNDVEHLFLWISSTSEGSSIRISELIFMPLQTLRGA